MNVGTSLARDVRVKSWNLRLVAFKFQLSDFILFSVSLPLQVREERLIDQRDPVARLEPPTEDLMNGSQGYLIRSLPITTELPMISQYGKFLCYTPLQYLHCYIDFAQSFEEYESKFSSKSRSTIKRKIKKYTVHCGGSIPWKTYTKPDEIQEFFKYARIISKKTYQEKLLDAGIPESDAFIRKAEALAAEKRLRAYILFDGDLPVSYLYCPVKNGVLMYDYLGYDPGYIRKSVGTVLQWLAVEQLFKEGQFRYFDFTQGESVHKFLFSTHQQRRANAYFIRKTLKNIVLIYSHSYLNRFSRFLGDVFQRLGLKSKIIRLLRHGK
jgi:hypothetical protein